MPRFCFRPVPLALAVSLVLGFFVTATAHAQTPAEATPIHFALPAQPLGQALNEVARQGRLQLLMQPELVAGKSAPALSGAMTVREALNRLLAGSGLEAVPDGQATLVRRVATPAVESALPAVTVTASADQPGELPKPYAGGQVARGGQLGLLGNTDFMETPFSVSSYTAELVENQQARTVAEMLSRNDASIRSTGSGDGNSTEGMVVRGFDMGEGGYMSLNGLPGIVAQYRSAMEFAERAELFKGPSAMLSGMSPSGAVGGGINLVTKRATDAPLTRLTTSYYSDSRPGVHADLGRRFGDNNEWGVRANLAWREGETARDYAREKARLGSIGLDYRGERVRASLDAIWQDNRQPGARSGLGFIAAPGYVVAPPRSRTNLDEPWAIGENQTTTMAAQVEYDITPLITGFAGVGGANSLWSGFTGNIALLDGSGRARHDVYNFAWDQRTRSAELGMRGRIVSGPVQHRWAVSLTRMMRANGLAFEDGGTVYTNIYAPIVHPPLAPAVVAPHIGRSADLDLPSIGIADTMSVLDDRIQLMLGLRRQRVKVTNYNNLTDQKTGSYDESAITPLAGLLFKATDRVSLYANYVQGLSQGDTAPATAANAGTVFPPYKSKQYEIGAKFDAGSYGATVALFQISKPSAGLDARNYFVLNGEQRNRGLELSVFGEPTHGLRLLSSATVIDGKMTQTPDRRNEGLRPVALPRVTANLGVEWDVPMAPGLTLTAAMMHTGATYVDSANTIRAPGWTRTDFGARYRASWAGRPVTLRATLENAFNKNYWIVGQWGGELSMPRTLLLSASVDF